MSVTSTRPVYSSHMTLAPGDGFGFGLAAFAEEAAAGESKR